MSIETDKSRPAHLTVAIPTYARNAVLLANLRALLPQITPACKLLILDNCSPSPVDETLRELLAQFPAVDCEIRRNASNIGANANILRCIEGAQTPWVWILGDDDTPLPGAIQTVLQTVQTHKDCTVINFAVDEKREREWTARGVGELAQTLDRSADLPWISSSVYQTDAFKDHLKFGYQYIYSMLPHLAVCLVALGKEGQCFFSRERIMDGEARDAEIQTEQQWSLVNLGLGFPVLFDLPMSKGNRETLAEKLLLTNLRPGNALRNVAFQLLILAVKQRDSYNALYYFDQIYGRHAWSYSCKKRLEAKLYRLLLRFPRLSARLYRLAKGHALSTASYQDRFNRM